MTNMAAMPMYGKNLKNLPLQNQLTDDLETWGVASSMQVLQRYLNYDHDPFYANVKFGHYRFCMGKSENYFWKLLQPYVSKLVKAFN